LFRPFRSTKDGGYGIGAYESRNLIQEMGGRLEVDSRPGEGTTMRVRLPRVDKEAVNSPAVRLTGTV
jgi:signal transduction histidine kinase